MQPDLLETQRDAEAQSVANQQSGTDSQKPTDQESLIVSDIESLSTLKENEQVRLPYESNLDPNIKNDNCDSEEQQIHKNRSSESLDSLKKVDDMLNEDFDMSTSDEDDANRNKVINQEINLGASLFRIPSTVTKCDNTSDNVLEIDLKTLESDCKDIKNSSEHCKLTLLVEKQSAFQVNDDINNVTLLNSNQLTNGTHQENITSLSSKAKKRPRSIDDDDDDDDNDNGEQEF